MGLFDGAAHPSVEPGFASTAHVAGLLRAPVVLVVDASAQARSVAALVHGFATFDPGVRLGGVILNRVGSDRHEAILREALGAAGVPVLGAVRRLDAAAHALPAPRPGAGGRAVAPRRWPPSRAARRGGRRRRRPRRGARAGPRPLPRWTPSPWDPAAEVAAGARAARGSPSPGGPAFTFGYAENAELLTAAGAEVVTVDPLRDEAAARRAPRGWSIGGGFPEVYAAELSANEPLRADVAALAARGAPIAAECAGLLYLARELDGVPMCGVLDVATAMSPRLTLGYRAAVAADRLGAGRRPARGCAATSSTARTADPPAGPGPAWQWSAGGAEGFVHGGVHASYLHLHWAGSPAAGRPVRRRLHGDRRRSNGDRPCTSLRVSCRPRTRSAGPSPRHPSSSTARARWCGRSGRTRSPRCCSARPARSPSC